MLSANRVATRSALLALKEEQNIVQEAYEFLDEKRLLLAAEVLRQLQHYEQLLAAYAELHEQARAGLLATVRRHGLHGTQIYPARPLDEAPVSQRRRHWMGVTLLQCELRLPESSVPEQISYRTPEAEATRDLFRQLVLSNGELAAVSGNLHRLLAEYQRTQRRARALENVVMPEIANDVRIMGNQLDEHDQEDVLRAHLLR